MRLTRTSDLWWKQAVVYCLDVQTFFDSDGDGVGDFAGLSQRIDHLADLGVDVIWLMPFYPTADVDDGYDITDFYAVDPRLGSFGDFVEFMRTAKDRGLRVIADLVCNHTSAEHPWFQAARSAPDSPYRDFYVWRDERPPEKPGDVVFPDKETSIWSYDRTAKQYYLHRFYRTQPDLNVANPRVRDEIAKIMGFWMELGLSGFRVDAVPFLIETAGIEGGSEALPDPHDYLRDLRAFLNRRRGDAVLLGEVNLSHQDARAFFGDEDGDEVTMLFDFPTMQAIWLALARRDAGPIRSALSAPAAGAGRLAVGGVPAQPRRAHARQAERRRAEEVFDAFGPEPTCSCTAAACDGGCRRCSAATSAASGSRTASCSACLARRRCSTARRSAWASSWRSTAGWPCARRCSGSPVRAVASHAEQLLPTVPGGRLRARRVNVQDQRHDPDSLLVWMRERIRRYRECPELAWGDASVLEHEVAPVLALRSDWEDGKHRAGPQPVGHADERPLELAGEPAGVRLVDLFDPAGELSLGSGGAVTIELEPYGTRWFRLLRDGERRLT